jgi:hypothetical protein
MPDLHLRIAHDDEMTTQIDLPPLSDDEAIAMMERAAIADATLIPWGSNYTFAVALTDEDAGERLAIYKPRRGEAPLWDFPTGTLYLREHAAYLVSRRLGWGIVPPTVIRHGPHGIGSLQLYVEPKEPADEDETHVFWSARRPEIERIVLFDHIVNNADRKLTHCLRGTDDRIWGIDHGLTFNVDPKLRTVLWQYVGDAISPDLLGDLQRLLEDEPVVREELKANLAGDEVDVFLQRVRRLVERGYFPPLDPRSNIPYGWW